MRIRGSIFLTGLVFFLAAPAQGATKLGETFNPVNAVGGPSTLVQDISPLETTYEVPAGGGVITSWSYDGPPSGTIPQMRLKLLRGTPTPGEFTVVGQSALEQPTTGPVSTFLTRVSVQGGEKLGLGTMGPSAPVRGGFLSSLYIESGDVGVGTTAAFNINSPSQLDVSAQLEPDADGDGFGDETQDGCPTDATTQVPCPPDVTPPDTTITKAPKKVKAKGTKAKLTIEFAASEQATFSCALDGRTTQCMSPYTAKVRRGKHLFTVVATDAAGNVDASPAKAAIKVKRKQRR